MILRASHTLVSSVDGGARWIDGGGVQIEGGQIRRVLEGSAAVVRAHRATGQRLRDLGEGLLLPGFVNAHAHLELGAMRLESGSFASWIGDILRTRRAFGPEDYGTGVEQGEARLLATGSTCVGDICSTQVAAQKGRRLRSVIYREVLDAWNEERSASVMAPMQRALAKRKLRQEGLSPHAPYTTSRKLLASAARLLARRPMPLSIHWSESQAELDWLARGEGEFASFFPPSPESSGLELLEQAGLLRPGCSLVHGNLPQAGEPERLAQAGVILVHCPGTHRFFERAAFPWQLYQRAGVRIALGTDSRASNADLDMRREMALARAGHAPLGPYEVFAMATEVGAKALGLGRRVGLIAKGWQADLAFHVGLPRDPEQALEALTMGQGEVAQSFVAGRCLHSS